MRGIVFVGATEKLTYDHLPSDGMVYQHHQSHMASQTNWHMCTKCTIYMIHESCWMGHAKIQTIDDRCSPILYKSNILCKKHAHSHQLLTSLGPRPRYTWWNGTWPILVPPQRSQSTATPTTRHLAGWIWASMITGCSREKKKLKQWGKQSAKMASDPIAEQQSSKHLSPALICDQTCIFYRYQRVPVKAAYIPPYPHGIALY